MDKFAASGKMILCVYRDANLNKQLNSLRKAGGQATVAADHAEAIIDRLIARGMHGLGQTGRFTRYGDARIKNCIKYDLVHGYRLVGMKKKDELTLFYVGNHDDCDLWIRHNTGIEPVTDKRRNEAISIQEAVVEVSPVAEACKPEPDYDQELLKRIDERDLQKIFRGICGR
ncbi:MAG: hypothetical protein LUQ69_09620 [Methanoregulaceae archaeon]|nr:hypothetical protein [Methanoregulaceae archaeon]